MVRLICTVNCLCDINSVLARRTLSNCNDTNHDTHLKRCPYFIGDTAEHVLDRRRRWTVRAWRSGRSFGLLDRFGKRPPAIA